MSLVLRLKKRDAAVQAAPLAGETAPGVLPPPPEPALDPEPDAPTSQSHLAPCPRCGAPNGLSASSCWNCEVGLLTLEPFRERRAPMPPAPAVVHVAGHVPAYADESLPVLTSALIDDKPMGEPAMAAVLESTPVPRGARLMWQASGAILVVAAAVGLWYLDASSPHSMVRSEVPGEVRSEVKGEVKGDVKSAVKGGGFVNAPELAAPPNIRPAPVAPVAPADDVGVRKGPPPAVAPIEPAPQREVAQPAATAALKANAGKQRSRSRPAPAEAEYVAPQPPRPDFSSRSPSPARPCNPTVAALGLCTATPVESKE